MNAEVAKLSMAIVTKYNYNKYVINNYYSWGVNTYVIYTEMRFIGTLSNCELINEGDQPHDFA